MPLHKRNIDDLRAFRAHVDPDDGINPREDKKCDIGTKDKQDRKLQQLCKQVEIALHLALPSISMLEDVRVFSVIPSPNAGRLRVMVVISDSCSTTLLISQLERCSGYLRAQVAQMISRRRAPELVFSIVTEDINDD